MSEEVRFERLRPQQIKPLREACPVAYLPIGTLEWHGFHNPVGLDTLKIERLCVRCAQVTGGLVFPALWYGESREEAMMEANAKDRDKIAEGYGVLPDNFAPGYMRRSPAEQVDLYGRLLVHILNEIQSYGFKLAVIAAGHYPLIDHARAAISIFHQQRYGGRKGEMMTWAFTGYELVKRDGFPQAGDHAAQWETSLMMALDETDSMVDLSVLPNNEEWPVGCGGAVVPQKASKEYGEAGVQAIVKKVDEQIKRRLEKPNHFGGHGVQF